MLDNLCAGFTSSLHHDLSEGRRLELEALHGHAVRPGKRHGIPTPMLFAVHATLKPYADGPPQAATGSWQHQTRSRSRPDSARPDPRIGTGTLDPFTITD